MVCVSYIVCGILGVYGFSSIELFPDSEIKQNCLDMLPIKDPLGIIIRACTFFQLLTICSLLFACQRSQILLLATGKAEASSDKVNLILNTLILILPCIIAITYPNVGKVASFLGGLGGMVVIYFIPTVTFMSQKKTEIANPVLVHGLRLNKFTFEPPEVQR